MIDDDGKGKTTKDPSTLQGNDFKPGLMCLNYAYICFNTNWYIFQSYLSNKPIFKWGHLMWVWAVGGDITISSLVNPTGQICLQLFLFFT